MCLHQSLFRVGRTDCQIDEPTLDDLLSEPIIMALMEADSVTPRDLEELLRPQMATKKQSRSVPRMSPIGT